MLNIDMGDTQKQWQFSIPVFIYEANYIENGFMSTLTLKPKHIFSKEYHFRFVHQNDNLALEKVKLKFSLKMYFWNKN